MLGSLEFVAFICTTSSMIIIYAFSSAAKQNSQVLGVYVESLVMGYGGCCNHGYCPCKRRGKDLYQLLTLDAFILLLLYSWCAGSFVLSL